MTLDQFRQLAETWGGDVYRWPAATRDAARKLAASDGGLRILEEQRRYDRLFAVTPEIDADRTDRAGSAVLQRLAAVPAEHHVPWLDRILRWPALVPAASLASSVLLGAWLAGAAPYARLPSDPLSVVGGVFDTYTIAFGVLQ